MLGTKKAIASSVRTPEDLALTLALAVALALALAAGGKSLLPVPNTPGCVVRFVEKFCGRSSQLSCRALITFLDLFYDILFSCLAPVEISGSSWISVQ